ncbi:MAG: 50S ribosomal protein L24 [Candidatus Levybacteria bacterium]|nr:50S ribosomal protein L24 [Candidatus Levybacteria bacterium]
MKLKKGDTVAIIKGKDKGKNGKIEKIFPNLAKVLLPEVNLYKRHVKSRVPQKPSEIVTLTKPISWANVALICPNCKKQTRVGYKIEGKEKIRICKKCSKKI